MTSVRKTSQRQRLDPAKRKEQLLVCAIEAYAISGVARAGHGDVAKLAGVSTATVFKYFPTREILTKSVLDEVRNKVKEFFGALPDNVQSAAEQIRNMAFGLDVMIDQNPDLMKVFLNWSVAFGPDVRPGFLSFQDEILAEITTRLSAGREDRSDARMIMASADMYAQMKLDKTDPDTIKRFVDRVSDALA
jgi:TetR/AcrR family hemagglutinin/protease transcriptional regulator